MTPSDEAARSVDCELTATSEAQPTEFVTSRRGVLLAALASAFLPTRRLVAADLKKAPITHPLDPLSASEMADAVRLLREGHKLSPTEEIFFGELADDVCLRDRTKRPRPVREQAHDDPTFIVTRRSPYSLSDNLVNHRSLAEDR